MTKTMAEVIWEHLEHYGDDYDLAYSRSIRRLADVLTEQLTAAGYGLVADAKREALERAAEDIDWIRPEMGPGINITQYREGRNDALTSAATWLRTRAAEMRQG